MSVPDPLSPATHGPATHGPTTDGPAPTDAAPARPPRRLRLLTGPPRGWHLALARALAAEGHAVSWAPGPGGWPAPVGALLRLEAVLHGLPGTGPRAPLAAGALAPFAGDGRAPDLVLDLRDDGGPPGEGPERSALDGPVAPVLSLAFDGAPGAGALLGALLEGRAPLIEAVAGPRALARGLPALEAPNRLAPSLDAALARAGEVALAGSRALIGGAAGLPRAGAAPGPRPLAAPRFAARALAGRARSRLARLLSAAPRWQVGWRDLGEGPTTLAAGGWTGAPFRWLPDDGARYHADPCPVRAEGRDLLFVETLPYATGRGIIGVAERGADGAYGAPRPVLEAAHHLSYPRVFARDGHWWMIPESGAAGGIDLYRARRFPDDWALERRLVDGVNAADATLHEAADGALWLLASVAAPGASTWDALGLFASLTGLLGAWRPHPLNPVLIDAGAARPAGGMASAGGRLLRPAQDCRAGYGAGLALCEVTRLDEGGFAQRTVARLAPPAGWAASGVHTLDAGGGVEAVDRFGAAR